MPRNEGVDHRESYSPYEASTRKVDIVLIVIGGLVVAMVFLWAMSAVAHA